MHQWYQEGLILRNASLRDEPATDRMRLGSSFGFLHDSTGIHWTATPGPVAQS